MTNTQQHTVECQAARLSAKIATHAAYYVRAYGNDEYARNVFAQEMITIASLPDDEFQDITLPCICQSA